MSDFALARESIEEVIDYSVLISEFDNGAEQRRLKRTNRVTGFKIKSPVLTKTQMQEYRDIFMAKYGSFITFTFTSPFDDIEYNVRFMPNSFKTVFNAGIFTCEFEFKVDI
jgi:hypothetical protein